ncbi:MAG: sensor histidine kinase [Spirochaetaceae bacterium]|nr:sensor histidine kinase [Spirochaetaceae bacterium]
MKKKILPNLSIEQNILIATLSIVMIVLLITSSVYYAVFTYRTDSLVESQSREINKQIVLNYESYINSVIETAHYIQYASLNLDVKDSYEKLQDVFLYNSEIKKDVVSLFLFDEEGNKLLGNDLNSVVIYHIAENEWFQNGVTEKAIFHFSAPHSQSVSLNRNEVIISVSRFVEFTYKGIKKSGVILIELNFRTLTDLAEKTNLGEGGHILILNDDDSLIYHSGKGYKEGFPESLQIAVEHYLGGFRTKIGNKEMFININTLIHTRWRIVTVNNINEIALARQQILLILLFIIIISFFVTTTVSLVISSRISRPMNELKKTMFKVENRDFNTKVEVTGQKEVVRLAKSFNSMVEEIRKLMKEVVSEQREKRKTELKALQNQINPHFLYNTLDSIVWLAENERSDDVVTTVIALARFFRISISKGETFIPVKDEISHIRNYLTIQKIRYVDKFEYKFIVEPEIYEYKVMKLILQPIVENAIYHGIGDETEKITIKAYKKDDFLIFEVENSGYGITEERIEEIYKVLKGTHSKSSVGMRNVYLRLKLFYGEEADIKISSILDEMTCITLFIPAESHYIKEP